MNQWPNPLQRARPQDRHELGRRLHKDVVVHTHFNHPNEITAITRDAMNVLTGRGIHVRSQARPRAPMALDPARRTPRDD